MPNPKDTVNPPPTLMFQSIVKNATDPDRRSFTWVYDESRAGKVGKVEEV